MPSLSGGLLTLTMRIRLGHAQHEAAHIHACQVKPSRSGGTSIAGPRRAAADWWGVYAG